MGDGWYAKRRDDLYERLLRRLAQALEQVDSIGHLQSGSAQELELVGLTTAELELIHAYLRGDLQRLRGWHAAAEQLAQFQYGSLRGGKLLQGRSAGQAAIRSVLCLLWRADERAP